MMHTRQNLEERQRALSDIRKNALGDADVPRVCRVCFMVLHDDDERSCICGRCDWTIIDVALIELDLMIDSLKPNAERAIRR